MLFLNTPDIANIVSVLRIEHDHSNFGKSDLPDCGIFGGYLAVLTI